MMERETREERTSTEQGVAQPMNPAIGFVTKSLNDWVTNLAGIFAYNLVMLMVPIALTLLTILGIIGQSSIRTTVVRQITDFFPGLASQQNSINLATQQIGQASGLLGAFSVLTAIIFGSLLFAVIEGCLDIIYRVRPRPLVKQYLVAIAMFIIFIILIPIVIFASAIPSVLFSSLSRLPLLRDIPGSSFIFLSLGGILGSLVAAFIFFEVMYLVIPNQRISWRRSWCGALVAAILAEIFLAIFPLVISLFFNTYAGPIGVAVILLLFLYIFAIIFLLGAEVNAYFFEGIKPIPNDLVTFLSTMAGRLNKDLSKYESPTHMDTRPTEHADDRHIAEAHEQGKV
jgi:YihY family inner membrane protein